MIGGEGGGGEGGGGDGGGNGGVKGGTNGGSNGGMDGGSSGGGDGAGPLYLFPQSSQSPRPHGHSAYSLPSPPSSQSPSRE